MTGAVVAADQLTKWWALNRLRHRPGSPGRHPRSGALTQHGGIVQPVSGAGRPTDPGGDPPGRRLMVMVWRSASTGRAAVFGLILEGHWATSATASSAGTMARWSTSSPCTSGPRSTWPMPPSWSGAPCWWCPGPGASDPVTVLTVVVPASLEGVRVDKAVALVADLSRSSVNSLVDEGRVQIDGATVRSRRTVLRTGQELRVDRGRRPAATGPRRRPGGGLRGGPCRPRGDRVGQASRAGGPSWRRAPRPAPWSRGCWPGSPSSSSVAERWGPTPIARASCTGSTGAPLASWWWLGRPLLPFAGCPAG